MATSITDVLRTAWQEFLAGARDFLPQLIAMLSLVVAGFLIAWVLSVVLRQVLRWTRFNRLADRAGISSMLRNMALPPAADTLASFVFWILWLAFLVSGLGALGFSGLEHLAAGFVTFLPRLVAGVVILVAGLIAANLAWRTTLLAAVNSSLPSARILSSAVRWLVVALAVAMALEQVGLAKAIMLTAFSIAFGAVMLGVGIAIGIGGAPVARRLLERQFPEAPQRPSSPDEEMSHL